MHVLITNDDGIQAPGLLALKQALEQVAEVTVLAPSRNWSASGHVKTMHKPLRVSETTLADGSHALMTTGAPSDCVALAFLGVVSEPIDIVVSGINQGPNLGHDVTYSGTVTAAMEGVISGVPSIAVSLNSFSSGRFDYAASFAARLALRLSEEELPPYTLLNVNVPDVPEDKIAGMLITRQGLRIYRDELVHRFDPRNRPYYWISGEPLAGEFEEGTDEWAVENNYVSVTPLQLDLTAHGLLERLREWKM